MNINMETKIPLDIVAILISCCSLSFTTIFSTIAIWRWSINWQRNRKRLRLEFFRDISNGFSNHNWKFIEYWNFPGVYPQLDELKDVIPTKTEDFQEAMGQRVVTLSHLNVLLKVFSHKNLLYDEDIIGYKNWAQNWYEKSVEPLRTILTTGDVYPLDFIIWLRDKIFKDKDFAKLLGSTLCARLVVYEDRKIFKSAFNRIRSFFSQYDI